MYQNKKYSLPQFEHVMRQYSLMIPTPLQSNRATGIWQISWASPGRCFILSHWTGWPYALHPDKELSLQLPECRCKSDINVTDTLREAIRIGVLNIVI